MENKDRQKLINKLKKDGISVKFVDPNSIGVREYIQGLREIGLIPNKTKQK